MHFVNAGNQNFVRTFQLRSVIVELARVQWKRTT